MEGIKVMRKRAGLTQAELAERAGVNQHHVSRWERGRVEPSRRNLEKVADALGIMPWEINLAQELVERQRAVEEAVAEYALAG